MRERKLLKIIIIAKVNVTVVIVVMETVQEALPTNQGSLHGGSPIEGAAAMASE